MSLFNWSLPQRKQGNRELIPIPPEIYARIFSYLEPSATYERFRSQQVFSNLSLVCRYFASQALPKVFKSLEVVPFPNESQGETQWCHFFRNLSHNDKMALQLGEIVQEVSFVDWTEGEVGQYAIIAFMHGVYGPGLKCLPNLKKLSFRQCALSLEIVQTISQLVPPVLDLDIRHCTLDDDVAPNFLHSLKLRRASILEHEPPEFCDLLDIEPVEHLDVGIDSMLTHFCHHPQHSSLSSLILSAPMSISLSTFPDVLSRCPNLEILKLENTISGILWEPERYLGLVPKLRCLEAMDCLGHLIRGRPITSLKIEKHGPPQYVLPLEESTRPITHLEIDVHYLPKTISFKKLRFLAIQDIYASDCEHDSDNVFTEGRKKFPNLSHLSFRMDLHLCMETSRSAQERLVQRLHEVFPALVDFDYGGIQWHLSNGIWFPAFATHLRQDDWLPLFSEWGKDESKILLNPLDV